ncbi:MAG: hypothetical protein QM405_09315 [Euryarchaeota archaeon]|nr:hypothetical protein [Euryarchaeota archaeon]
MNISYQGTSRRYHRTVSGVNQEALNNVWVCRYQNFRLKKNYSTIGSGCPSHHNSLTKK